MLAKQCLDEYRLECELRSLAKRTIQGYFNNVSLFLTFIEKQFHTLNLEDITPPHIKRYIAYLMGKKRAASYINRIIICLRGFFNYAVQEQYISTNPVHKVKYLKEPKVLITTFTDNEVLSLLNAFDYSSFLSTRNKLILAIAFDTGARNTEICSIKQYDISENKILIHGKGNKERHIPISPYLRKIMYRYERIRDYYFQDKILRYDHYLLSRTGQPLTKEALEHVFSKAKELATIRDTVRCSPHTARHFYAQSCLKNGLDVYTVSRLLGHESINITKRYLQSLNDSSIVEMAAHSSPLSNLKP